MAANAVRRYVFFNTIRDSRLRDRGQETILYSFKGGDGGSVPSSALIDVGVRRKDGRWEGKLPFVRNDGRRWYSR
jgi:hypothetical protein